MYGFNTLFRFRERKSCNFYTVKKECNFYILAVCQNNRLKRKRNFEKANYGKRILAWRGLGNGNEKRMRVKFWTLKMARWISDR